MSFLQLTAPFNRVGISNLGGVGYTNAVERQYPVGFYVSSYSKQAHNHRVDVRSDIFNGTSAGLEVSAWQTMSPDTIQAEVSAMWLQAKMYYACKMSQDAAYAKLMVTHESCIRALQLTPAKLYSKLRHLSRASGDEHPGRDAFDFIADLQERSLKEHGFVYSFNVDDKRALESVFYMTAMEVENVKKYGKDMIVVDTTHQTNFHEMFLFVVVMENKHGDTILGGKGFVAHQDTENFMWLFRTLKRLSGVLPSAVMSDSDAAIAAA